MARVEPKAIGGPAASPGPAQSTEWVVIHEGRMKKNILATAAGLSDQDLLARLKLLAEREREATVDLLAHLATLDSRPAAYAARGYGSLFSYCTHALRLSEHAACNRIEAARACRRFPVMLDLLASGGTSSARGPGRRPRRDLRPRPHAAPRERREDKAWSGD